MIPKLSLFLDHGRRRPAAAATLCYVLILAGQWAARFVPPAWEGHWPSHIVRLQTHFVDRFYPFDAVWYWRIATQGYGWDPAQPMVMQDIAFFPLWPFMERVLLLCGVSGTGVRWSAVALAAGFGFASICGFDDLARQTLARPAARTAIWLFALYPGAGFLLLSYPTGLMNVLTILATLQLLRGAFWRAAGLCCVLTLSGPLGLGTAMMVFVIAAWRAQEDLRAAGWARAMMVWEAVRLAALGVLSISGLAGFIIWQALVLGDPFAFMAAQVAWELPMPFWTRLPRAAGQVFILPEFWNAIHGLKHVSRPSSPVWLINTLEKSLNNAAQGLGMIGVILCRWCAPAPLLVQGVCSLALFIWFHSAMRPGNSTLRLIYCVPGMFLGAAWVLARFPVAARSVICVSAIILFGGALLVAAGHHMT